MTGPGDGVTGPRLGVTLFSLGGLFWRRRMSVAGCLAAVAGLGADQGIELVGGQMLRTFPAVTDAEVRAFRDAVDRTGVVPVCYCAYVERARSRDRLLSPPETVPLIEQEIDTAVRLGFPMVRINTATPELLRALAPVARARRVPLVVELATEPRTDPSVRALLAELDRLDTPWLGVLQDFSAFVRAVPAPFVEAAIADGAPAGAMAVVVDAWRDGRPVADVVDEIARGRWTPPQRQAAVQAAHIAYALFRRGDAGGLRDVLPWLRHVQAKFFAVGADGAEPCVPYDELVPALRDAGYRGRIHSEFEGFLWSDELDAVEQLARQQDRIRALWRG